MKFCKSKENKIALVGGLFLGGLHAIWALLVAVMPVTLQNWLNWIFNVHFLQPIWVLTAFNFLDAIMLTIFTFVVGYVATLLLIWLLKVMKVKK